jgi:hypothetical protein
MPKWQCLTSERTKKTTEKNEDKLKKDLELFNYLKEQSKKISK